METVKARVRFDYRGYARPGRLFMGHKSAAEMSVENRDRETAVLRYTVTQGVRVDDIDASAEAYVVSDPLTGDEVAYAPVYITVTADSVEDLAEFALRDEFRTIEVIDPQQVTLSVRELGRLLARANARMRSMAQIAARRSDRY